MNKQDFQSHTRYTVTLRNQQGLPRPASLYVYRLHDSFMIARMTEDQGLLHRIAYEEVLKIVKTTPVRQEDRYAVPEALLNESFWAEKTTLEHYSTSPHAGK